MGRSESRQLGAFKVASGRLSVHVRMLVPRVWPDALRLLADRKPDGTMGLLASGES